MFITIGKNSYNLSTITKITLREEEEFSIIEIWVIGQHKEHFPSFREYFKTNKEAIEFYNKIFQNH